MGEERREDETEKLEVLFVLGRNSYIPYSNLVKYSVVECSMVSPGYDEFLGYVLLL